ncbi:hypothetical protein IW261DRAFT_1556994 [Armillaria novae-zelandiae]|uniref:Transmembrane protein n=1 Tax=Armillaria novae-zelandiae TaxID=153914 RepID=A0AA39PQ89_9AGAR|nr:hypothetical protein IW261DRAFT_1556994 [Armillaria novae-zelandiae]
MLFVTTACIIQTLFVVWLPLSVSELLATTTGISWRWLDAAIVDVGLPEPNTTLAEMDDAFFKSLVIPPSPNEPDDMDALADDAPPQGIIGQLLEPAAAVVEVTLLATTPVDDAVPLVSVHPQPTQSPASVTRVRPLLRSSSLSDSIAPVSLFAITIAVFVGFVVGFFAHSVSLSIGWDGLPTLFVEVCAPSETIKSCDIDSIASSAVEADSGEQISEVVVEEVLVLEKAEHGKHLQATDNMASIPSGSVSSSDDVEPLRTSIGVQFTSDVCETKDVSVSVGTEPVSKTSVGIQCSLAKDEQTDISVGTDPVSNILVGIQCSVATDEQTDEFTPSESRASLFATASEGTLSSQTTDGPDVFTVPTVSSNYNIYMLAATTSFPSVDDLANISEFECLRQDIRGLGDESEAEGSMAPTLPATELGVTPSTTPSAPASPRPVQAKPLEPFRDRWGRDTKYVWAREIWHRALRSEELMKILYEEVFPLDNVATEKDKYDMEFGEGLVNIVSYNMRFPSDSQHCVGTDVGIAFVGILRLPYNVLPEDADSNDSLFVSAEANETMVSSSDSVGSRSPSPFVRSRLLESSSSEASVVAPTPRNGVPSPSRIPVACRNRPALAQVTSTPRGVQTTPSRTWTPMNAVRVRGVEVSIPTPPPSVRPKLAKDVSRFPPVAPSTPRMDESGSPTRPARRGSPSSSKLPRWRG